MRVFRVVGFYVTSIVVLGSFGFIGLLLSDRILFRSPLWPVDALSIWALSIVVTAIFLTFICTPIQFLAHKSRFSVSALAGILSGPISVWLLLLLRGEPFSVRNYLTAAGTASFHLLLGTIGLLFALGFRVYGPNNSFKPNPLRGSA